MAENERLQERLRMAELSALQAQEAASAAIQRTEMLAGEAAKQHAEMNQLKNAAEESKQKAVAMEMKLAEAKAVPKAVVTPLPNGEAVEIPSDNDEVKDKKRNRPGQEASLPSGHA